MPWQIVRKLIEHKNFFTYFIFFLAFNTCAGDFKYNHHEINLLNDKNEAITSTEDTLVFGVFRHNTPPFDVFINNQFYDGINADFFYWIGHYGNKRIKIRVFNDTLSAEKALIDGEVDIVTGFTSKSGSTSNSFDRVTYIPGISILSVVNKLKIQKNQEMKVLVSNELISDDEIKNIYPYSVIERTDSPIYGLLSASIGQSDVFISDAITIGYFSKNTVFYNLSVNGRVDCRNCGIKFFTVRKDDNITKEIIMTGISKMPKLERYSAVSKWDKSSDFITPGASDLLNDKECKWIKSNRSIKVILPEDMPPFSFIDDGKFVGGIPSLLKLIENTTGIEFTFISDKNILSDSDNGKVIIGMASSMYAVDKGYSFTRKYAQSPVVMVNLLQAKNAKNKPQLIATTLDIHKVRQLYPSTEHVIQTKTIREAYQMLQKGIVYGVIDIYSSARYYDEERPGFYVMTAPIKGKVAKLSFGIPKNEIFLNDIINKSLKQIPDSAIDELAKKWSSPKPQKTFFQRYHIQTIIFIMVISFLIFIISMWVVRLINCLKINNKARENLNNQLLSLKNFIDETPNPMYVCDKHMMMISCNASYSEFLNLQEDDLAGTSEIIFLYQNDDAVVDYRNDVRRAITEKTSIIKDRKIRIKNSPFLLYVHHWIVPYANDKDEIIGVVEGWIDVTERKILEEKLIHADSAKSTFLATMSHEIRTPLNAIIGMLEIGNNNLKKGMVDSTAFDVAERSSLELHKLIGNILDIQKIESGKLTPHCTSIELRTFFENLVAMFKDNAKKKNLILNLILDKSTYENNISTDEILLRQVVCNVLSNAIKFTDKGNVKLHVVLQPSEFKNGCFLNIQICDTGCGISLPEQELLFKPFSQVYQNPDKRSMGSGLGLSICKSICEALGGSISLSSKVGLGTTVSISVAVKYIHQNNTQPKAFNKSGVHHHKELRILLVDDYYPNLLVLKKQLTFLNCEVVECEDPVRAVEIWQTFRPHITFTDYNMSGLDGPQLTTQILEIDSKAIIIGLTADARPEVIEICIRSGMVDCIFKPINLEILSNLLSRYTKFDINDNFSIVSSLDYSTDPKFKASLSENSFHCISDLHDALSDSRFNDIRTLAHKLKGGLTLGHYNELVTLCTKLESAAEHKNANECTELLLKLEDGVSHSLF